MRMTDKAGGELGKSITHPLQAKVDRIIKLNLGHQVNWTDGDRILASRFQPIRNQEYVRKHMERLGFVLDETTYKTYVYADSVKTLSKIKNKLNTYKPRAKPEKAAPIKAVKKSSKFGVTATRKRLLDGETISTKNLEEVNLVSLSVAIHRLKKQGFDIETTKYYGGGIRYREYKLKTL